MKNKTQSIINCSDYIDIDYYFRTTIPIIPTTAEEAISTFTYQKNISSCSPTFIESTMKPTIIPSDIPTAMLSITQKIFNIEIPTAIPTDMPSITQQIFNTEQILPTQSEKYKSSFNNYSIDIYQTQNIEYFKNNKEIYDIIVANLLQTYSQMNKLNQII